MVERHNLDSIASDPKSRDLTLNYKNSPMTPVSDAQLVKTLREKTNAGLMECKRALAETSGDLEAAIDLLRKKGAASAAKKAGREAKEGVIAEINCETDFVAKNDGFRAFCDEVARKIAQGASPEALEADRVTAVQKI